MFLAVGAQIGKRAYIPAGSAAKIVDAVDAAAQHGGRGEAATLGRRVVIYGGGDTALDAARTAKRLGAEEAIIVYRRTREKMPAQDFEVEEAIDEGILLKWLTTIKRADEGKLVVEKMELDETGFPQPTGELEELEADSVVLALGQDTDLSLIENVPGIAVEDGTVQVDDHMMTGHDGIFAGGDMVPFDRTVTVAIGHGRVAAHTSTAGCETSVTSPSPRSRRPASMHSTPGTTRTPRRCTASASPRSAARRRSTRSSSGLNEDNALFEARRCMSCGSCFACDNCYGVCPDNAVMKLEPGGSYAYDVDLDYCKGCGICAKECPCGAIEMVPGDDLAVLVGTGLARS